MQTAGARPFTHRPGKPRSALIKERAYHNGWNSGGVGALSVREGNTSIRGRSGKAAMEQKDIDTLRNALASQLQPGEHVFHLSLFSDSKTTSGEGAFGVLKDTEDETEPRCFQPRRVC